MFDFYFLKKVLLFCNKQTQFYNLKPI